jgi:hypothetical protein
MTTDKTKILSKGYSWLLAIFLACSYGLLGLDYKVDCREGRCNYSYNRKDIPLPVTLFFVVAIFGSIGLPTDGIAITVGKVLSRKKIEESENEEK